MTRNQRRHIRNCSTCDGGLKFRVQTDDLQPVGTIIEAVDDKLISCEVVLTVVPDCVVASFFKLL